MTDDNFGKPGISRRAIGYGLLFAAPFWFVAAAIILLLSGCAHCAWFCNPFIRG